MDLHKNYILHKKKFNRSCVEMEPLVVLQSPHLSSLTGAIMEPLQFCWHVISQTSWRMRTSIDDNQITHEDINVVKGLCGKTQ